MPKEYACRKCKALTTGKVCPVCQSTDLSPEWSGLIVVFDTNASKVAKATKITKPGRYALKVS
ncbi:MAG: DNA-directed RNA polymerase, subunit E'' [Thaumarchaeota archaeon]|nr:DNA-directed RNA polymerase, subunit E'' [Nitrososphaerota archaeon]